MRCVGPHRPHVQHPKQGRSATLDVLLKLECTLFLCVGLFVEKLQCNRLVDI